MADLKKFRVVCDPIIDTPGWENGTAKKKLMIEVDAFNSKHAANVAFKKLNIHPANYAVFTWDVEEEQKYNFKKQGGCWETCENWGKNCHTKPLNGGPCKDKYKEKKEQ